MPDTTRFELRMPRTIHDALARQADDAGISMHTYVYNALVAELAKHDHTLTAYWAGYRDANRRQSRPDLRKPQP